MTEVTEPSKVIHVRNVGPEISENDLLQLFQPFGVITKYVILQAQNQAFLQMQDIPSALSVLKSYSNRQPTIRGRKLYIQFSSYEELTTGNQVAQAREEPNRILLVTIHHLLYPITVEVLHQVFSPHGFVEKIVTFQKPAGFQALIQYLVQQNAVIARNFLQGFNIFDGCCQLDIQFSNVDELQVYCNSERSRGFMNPSLPSEQMTGYENVGVGYPQMANKAAAIASAFGGSLPAGISRTGDWATIVVSNLDAERIDEDKIFNLFSIYGNIVRIKILQNSRDHALVQMVDRRRAELAMQYLKGAKLFGKHMKFHFSKYPNIMKDPYTREYSNSILNRFNRNTARNYRFCSPTKMIYLSSLPQNVTEEEVTVHLEEHGTIVKSLLFEMNGKTMSLVLFENEEQATEALVCKHATNLGGSVISISFTSCQHLSIDSTMAGDVSLSPENLSSSSSAFGYG